MASLTLELLMPFQLRQAFPTPSLSDRAYDILRKEIISGNLAPGEKLNVHDLAAAMQISRTPIKEAINRLAEDGLVTIRSRKSTFVSLIEPEKLREIFDIRLKIELWGAERACCQPELLDFTQLEQIVKGCEPLFLTKHNFDYEKFVRADIQFHQSLVKAAQNAHLLKLYRELSVHFHSERVYWGQAIGRALESQHEHMDILKSLREGSWEKINNSLTTHILRSRDDVVQRTQEVPRMGRQA